MSVGAARSKGEGRWSGGEVTDNVEVEVEKKREGR
jgi:hypothetical protein